MITVTAMDKGISHKVIPTVFPDGTTQVWKLPKEIIDSINTKIIWNYENDGELMSIASLRALLSNSKFVHLHMPFLPYGRQDKYVSNESTFNLHVLGSFLNILRFSLISSVDVHNPTETGKLIYNFLNIEVNDIIMKLMKETNITQLVYPDYGASMRYKAYVNYNESPITGHKLRNPSTGQIDKLTLDYSHLDANDKLLIIDDICDGGATFTKLAHEIKKIVPYVEINLFVTHGIFSKGRQILLDAGIKNIYTTDTLLKNSDGIKV